MPPAPSRNAGDRSPRQAPAMTHGAAPGHMAGRSSTAGQMPHPALGSLAFVHFLSWLRLAAIQRAWIDVCRPQRGHQNHPTHNHHQTKATHSLRHLLFVPLIYRNSPADFLPVSMHEACQPTPRGGNFPHLRDTTGVMTFQAITKFFFEKKLTSLQPIMKQVLKWELLRFTRPQ